MNNIQKHTRYLIKDLSGELSFLQHTAIIRFKRIFWTLYNRIKCFLSGIIINNNTGFIGNTIFSRHQLSSIEIGEKCLFNSSSNFNLIGLNHNCIISTHSEEAIIQIGNNCGFSGTVVGAFKRIKIGDNVRCGANTVITDFDWHLDDPRTGEPKEINIGDNVWLGINCIVLKGVTISENALIGANSVVTKDIPANVIAAGNPCKVIKEL